MRKAETAILRMANDQYRKVIFNSQIYYNTGAGTYEKAVDMATKDYLSRGINCIEYKNGARVNIASYAGMALRTANTRAYCQGEGAKRQEWGITTVIVNKRGLPCPKCGRWAGKILIDDVWSGGKASDGPYPLMSTAMEQGLYHPNCKDGHTTYFPGITEEAEPLTMKEIDKSVETVKLEQKQQYAQRQADRFQRLADYSLDEDNQRRYRLKTDEWEAALVQGDKSELQEVNAITTLDDESDYIASKKYYDEQVEHLNELEKESDDLLDAYMAVMDTPDADSANKSFEQKFEEVESFKQILKDLKARLTGKEAKAVRQVEKNLAIKSGIPIGQVNMTGMPYDSAKTVYDSYKTVLNLYPELKGNLSGFSYTKDFSKGAYAACTTLTGNIKVYGYFSDFEKMMQLYADDVAEGFHPIGTDYRSIIVHELGHALDGYMTKNKLLGADFNQYGILSYSSSVAKDMVLSHLGFDRQGIATELKNQGLKLADRRDILKQRERDFIKQHISEYAADNAKEFFAECFAEYVMSDNPREAASFFGEVINTSLGR